MKPAGRSDQPSFRSGDSAYWARGFVQASTEKDLYEDIEKQDIRSLVTGVIWPSTDMTPRELGTEEVGGIDPIDFVTRFITRQARKRLIH